jgi:hypothetical protein
MSYKEEDACTLQVAYEKCVHVSYEEEDTCLAGRI